MAADKVQCKALGEAFVALVAAVGDGVDPQDAMQLIAFVSALQNAADDIKSDTDAGIAYALSGAAEAFGNRKVG